MKTKIKAAKKKPRKGGKKYMNKGKVSKAVVDKRILRGLFTLHAKLGRALDKLK